MFVLKFICEESTKPVDDSGGWGWGRREGGLMGRQPFPPGHKLVFPGSFRKHSTSNNRLFYSPSSVVKFLLLQPGSDSIFMRLHFFCPMSNISGFLRPRSPPGGSPKIGPCERIRIFPPAFGFPNFTERIRINYGSGCCMHLTSTRIYVLRH